MDERLGLIGIGYMGSPIAESILRKGFPLTVFDIKKDRCDGMKSKGAEIASSPEELAKKSNRILLVVNDAKGVKQLLFDKDGIAAHAGKEAIIIDMTTSDPIFSQRFFERLAKRGIKYLDAPMTGGPTGAKNAQLLLMVGGERDAYERCLPVFELISKKALYVGNSGSGHLMKLIHNQLSHATFLATCEAVSLGEKLGLSLNTMIDVFNQGNARSYSTEVRFPKFILSGTYDMGATFNTVYKDISIVRRVGKRARMRLPINNCTYQYWKYAIDQGLGEEDWAKIFPKMRERLSR